MAFIEKTWSDGDTVTAEEMNRMENGISSGQKIVSSIYEPTSERSVNLVGCYNATSNGEYNALTNKNLRAILREGTTEQEGESILTLGNATKKGTAGNAKGMLRLYSSNGAYINLGSATENITGNRAINFQNKSGTIAYTADIPVTEQVSVTMGGLSNGNIVLAGSYVPGTIQITEIRDSYTTGQKIYPVAVKESNPSEGIVEVFYDTTQNEKKKYNITYMPA